MLTRPSPDSIDNNPLLDSPFNQQNNIGTSFAPSVFGWDLLSGDRFSWLDGSDWDFLGPI